MTKIEGLNWQAASRLRRAIADEIKGLEGALKATVEVAALKDQAKAADYWEAQIAEIREAIGQLRGLST